MKIIQLERGGGKTTKLVEMMLADPSLVYLAPTQAQADLALRMARQTQSDTSRKRFQRADAFAQRQGETPITVVVDELEGVLTTLLGATVAAATHTEQEGVTP